ncbi:MAG TPA: MFS transporter [Trebonia sp.]|nr:MFS transporter [Trebonia sp.]
MTARRGPLADSYPAAAGLVIFALVPYLLLTGAMFPLLPVISASLGLGKTVLELALGLADGAYAFGTVLAVQLAVRFPARRLLLGYVALFLVAAVLAAWAPAGWVFVVALVIEGLCTSLMLIAAAPPLVTGWPVRKLPVTGFVMNLCVFGAVAAGPSIGGLQASAGQWRPLFWGVAGVAALALLLALATFEDEPPHDDGGAPWDVAAVLLAGAGCGAAFFGASQLQVAGPGPAALIPLTAGVAMLAALIVHQYRAREPLMPVRQLATTFPGFGILVATTASASAIGLMELVLTAAAKKSTPGALALQFLPEFGAAIITAVVFALLFRTRFTPVLAFAGLVLVAASAALLTGLASGGGDLVAAGSGLIGLGVGASVSPALFITGFSLRAAQIQRVFAFLELLRGVTAFLVAPILLYLAIATGGSPAAGTQVAVWVCLAIAVAGAVGALAVFVLGGERLQAPDLQAWNDDGEPAWESTPLLGRLRGKKGG